jgi:hypothetical protein
MTDKIINITDRHKKQQHNCCDDKTINNENGFYYVCLKKDDNGKFFDESHLIERANSCEYLVRVMVHDIDNPNHPHIYNYKVPGEKILEFLAPYIKQEIIF